MAKQSQVIKNIYELEAYRFRVVKAGKRLEMWSEKVGRESGGGLFQRTSVTHTEQM
jgi:hypothetical protein